MCEALAAKGLRRWVRPVCVRLLPKARLECVWLLQARADRCVCLLPRRARVCGTADRTRCTTCTCLAVGCCCSCMRCLRSRLPLPLSQMCQSIDNVRLRITSCVNTITYP